MNERPIVPNPCEVCGDEMRRGERMGGMHCRTCKVLIRYHYKCQAAAIKMPHCLKCKPRPQQPSLPFFRGSR